MSIHIIPLNPYPEQFQITLNDTLYTLKTKFNPCEGVWVLDIGTSDEDWLITGLNIVPGCNLLEQFGYLNLGFDLYIMTDTDAAAYPEYENLGSDSNLYIVIEES